MRLERLDGVADFAEAALAAPFLDRRASSRCPEAEVRRGPLIEWRADGLLRVPDVTASAIAVRSDRVVCANRSSSSRQSASSSPMSRASCARSYGLLCAACFSMAARTVSF